MYAFLYVWKSGGDIPNGVMDSQNVYKTIVDLKGIQLYNEDKDKI